MGFCRSAEEMFLSVGARIGYFQGDPRKLVDDIGELRPTIFFGAPCLETNSLPAGGQRQQAATEHLLSCAPHIYVSPVLVDDIGELRPTIFFRALQAPFCRMQCAGLCTGMHGRVCCGCRAWRHRALLAAWRFTWSHCQCAHAVLA